MSKTLTVTITVQMPDGMEAVVKAERGDLSEWSIEKWSGGWRADVDIWADEHSDMVSTALRNALLRVARYGVWYGLEAALGMERSRESLRHGRTRKPYPDFYDALPLIASGRLKIRDVGAKGVEVISSTLIDLPRPDMIY